MQDVIKAASKIAKGLWGLNPKSHWCSSQWGHWGLAQEFYWVSTSQILPFQIRVSWYQLAPDHTKRELPFGDLLFHLLLPIYEQKMILEQSNSDSIKMDFFLTAQLARKLYISYWRYLDKIDCIACAMLLPPVWSQSPTPSLKLKIKFPHPPRSLQTLITIPADEKYLQ